MKRLIASIALVIATALGMTCASTKPTAASKSEPLSQEAATPKPSDDGKGDLSNDAPNVGLSHNSEVPPLQAEPDATGRHETGAGDSYSKLPSTSPVVFTQPPAQPPYRQPAVLSGHYEQYGLFGRKTRWVSNQPAYQPRQQTFGGCSGPGCGGRR